MAKKQNSIEVAEEYMDILDLEVKKRFIEPTSKDTIT